VEIWEVLPYWFGVGWVQERDITVQAVEENRKYLRKKIIPDILESVYVT